MATAAAAAAAAAWHAGDGKERSGPGPGAAAAAAATTRAMTTASAEPAGPCGAVHTQGPVGSPGSRAASRVFAAVPSVRPGGPAGAAPYRRRGGCGGGGRRDSELCEGTCGPDRRRAAQRPGAGDSDSHASTPGPAGHAAGFESPPVTPRPESRSISASAAAGAGLGRRIEPLRSWYHLSHDDLPGDSSFSTGSGRLGPGRHASSAAADLARSASETETFQNSGSGLKEFRLRGTVIMIQVGIQLEPEII